MTWPSHHRADVSIALTRRSDWRFDKLITEPAYNLFGWTSGGTWCFLNGFCLWTLAEVRIKQSDLSLVGCMKAVSWC